MLTGVLGTVILQLASLLQLLTELLSIFHKGLQEVMLSPENSIPGGVNGVLTDSKWVSLAHGPVIAVPVIRHYFLHSLRSVAHTFIVCLQYKNRLDSWLNGAGLPQMKYQHFNSRTFHSFSLCYCLYDHAEVTKWKTDWLIVDYCLAVTIIQYSASKTFLLFLFPNNKPAVNIHF